MKLAERAEKIDVVADDDGRGARGAGVVHFAGRGVRELPALFAGGGVETTPDVVFLVLVGDDDDGLGRGDAAKALGGERDAPEDNRFLRQSGGNKRRMG
jgi:hypothetical protein